MGITAYSGPIVQYGTVQTSTAGTGIYGQDMEHNDQRGPMVSDLGDAFLDPRVAYGYQPGSGVTAKTFAFFNNQAVVDYVPTTASTNAFVSQTLVTTGVTTFTLNAASSAAGTYATTIIAPETGKATGTLLAIDSTAAYLTFGSAATLAVWNPGCGPGRCLAITTSSSGDGGTWSIAGRDFYGYKISEQLGITDGTTNSSGYTIYSRKAYKYVSSITNATTPVSTGITIGIADRFEFPWFVPYAGLNVQVQVMPTSYSSAGDVVLSSANAILGANSSVTQTSTTANPRGVFVSSVASNNTVRLQMIVTPAASAVAAIGSTNITPLFGATSYSSV